MFIGVRLTPGTGVRTPRGVSGAVPPAPRTQAQSTWPSWNGTRQSRLAPSARTLRTFQSASVQ
jgi:hypothetical protein